MGFWSTFSMLDALLNLKPSVTSWTLYTTTYLKSPWIFVCLAIELSADSFGENRNDDNSSAQAHRQNLQCPLGFVGAIGSEGAARRAVSVRWRTTAPWIRQACGDSGQKIVLKRKPSHLSPTKVWDDWVSPNQNNRLGTVEGDTFSSICGHHSTILP